MKSFIAISGSLLLGASLSANAYYTSAGKIFDEAGSPIVINGISWSGFQDTNIFQGLQNNPFYAIKTGYNPREYGLMDLLSHPWDFPSSGVDKSTAVQFKTLRLPIQPGVLYDNTGEVDLNKSFSDKKNPTAGNGLFCQKWQQDGIACEKAVSPKEAFWTVLQEMQKHHINVMLDFHHRYGYGDGYRDGTVYNLNQYAKDIQLVAEQIKQRGLSHIIGIDLFNEPYRLNWFQPNGSQVPWTKVIATAANTIYKTNPELLLFVEGADGGNDGADNPTICVEKEKIVDNPNGYSHSPDPALCGPLERVFFKGNWGEDFKPLLNESLAKQGIPAFDKQKLINELTKQGIEPTALNWLLGDDKGHKSHLVFSPHVYPAEVAGWETAPGAPSNLRFDWTWGFLHKAGYPVVLGEASWKSEQGKAFFTKALMPYLNKSIGTNNIYFWAIGFLGDTVSAINPNTGSLNLDVQRTLKPYFSDVTPSGALNISFLMNTDFQGDIGLTLAANGQMQQYACSLREGCALQLPQNQYQVGVPVTYQLKKEDKTLYQIQSASLQTVDIQKDGTAYLQLPLQITISAQLAPHTIQGQLKLEDENGQALTKVLAVPLTIQFAAKDEQENTTNCIIYDKACQAALYNDQVNDSGQFANKVFAVTVPDSLQDVDGKTYHLKKEGLISEVTLTRNQVETIELPLAYIRQSIPGSGGSDSACTANITVSNYWQTGAVFQGTITNTSQDPIRHFIITLDLDSKTVSNVQLVNAWTGGNMHNSADNTHLVLSADTWDQYNGLQEGQSQGVGFQINAQLTTQPKIVNVSCQ